ncbi:MAG: phosphoribosylformylglycinamidine synthase subunit PurQ [Anaerovoracaceae bacterium]|jgi:phosphoribosylformylglycinamidine synthase
MMIDRIYTEKKKGFDVEAKSLLRDIHEFLKISSVTGLRILNRYDIEGIDNRLFERCIPIVFAEPQTDDLHGEIPRDVDCSFTVEPLPGQYDQRADSCAQCIQFISGGERPRVKTAKTYLLYGNISKEELDSIKSHIINPIESRETWDRMPQSLTMPFDDLVEVASIDGFTGMGDGELRAFGAEYGLAMDNADLAFCRDYFKDEGREPTETEIRMIDTYWSDHCRHTTFSTIIDEVEIADDLTSKGYQRYLDVREELDRTKPITLMDMATIGARYLKEKGVLLDLDESEEINAYTVKIKVDVDGDDEDWLLMFKNETHNHPTEIEPFGGAATCVGGAIRDPLSGRAFVYQAMRISGASDPTAPVEDTILGKLPQRIIDKKAAAGYSSYGNQIGLAAGLIDEIYHPGYVAKRMELGALIGAAPAANVKREVPVPGDVVVLLGGRTGRDGCGAASGSSKSHTASSLETGGAEVQKGNALEERKIVRLFRKPQATRLIKRCNDFGAGGVSVAIGELADGIRINLDAVPVKYEGLSGTELAISESQERMAIVLDKNDVDAFCQMAAEENLEATPVAVIQEDPRLVMEWRGKTIVDISREFLNSNGAKKHTRVQVNPFPPFERTGAFRLDIPSAGDAISGIKYGEVGACRQGCCCVSAHAVGGAREDIGKAKTGARSLPGKLCSLASDLNVCSLRGISEGFDATAGGGTILMPLGGKRQKTPIQSMVAKVPLLKGDTNTCTTMAYGFNPFISEKNQYAGAYLAVIESVAKIVSTGGDLNRCYLSFQEYFEKLGADPARWGKPFASLVGAFNAQLDLGLAAIGGKDSMSGSFENLDVPPTLISFAVSICHREDIISPEFKKAGSKVYLLSPEMENESKLPKGENLRKFFDQVSQLIREKRIISAYTPGYGGVPEALIKMTMGNRIGFVFEDYFDSDESFKYNYGSFIVESQGDLLEPSQFCGRMELMGHTVEEYIISHGLDRAEMEDIERIYECRLEEVFPCKTLDEEESREPIPKISYGERFERAAMKRGPLIGTVRPKVLIPVFPGTTCEYETANAFDKAGGDAEVFIVRNLTPIYLDQSVAELIKIMDKAQIILLPGGLSGGDEPDGSAKFITSFFSHLRLRDALNRFIHESDGLIGGIGNGFQALVKMGLLPFGEIREPDESSPTIGVNSIGRHQSKLVETRIASVMSPWLCSCNVGDIYREPVSVAEGRFLCSKELFNALDANGQIAAQYVDHHGNPTMDIQFNPAGSAYAIEAISSADGRIFGKMCNTERIGTGLYKNVGNTGDNGMFKNAVEYFK